MGATSCRTLMVSLEISSRFRPLEKDQQRQEDYGNDML